MTTMSHAPSCFAKSQYLGKALAAPLKSATRSSTSTCTKALFGLGKKKASAPAKLQTIVPEPSYAIPATLAGITALSAVGGAKIPAAIAGLLGVFLAIQASRVRFRFEADALEVVIGDKEEKSDNKFVGGENRWKYDTFTNWEFWWPNFPVLVYFKETQTKPEGQIHFFPIIFNGKQLYDVMSERCGASQTSGPK